jgi:NAD+ kinase
MRIFLLGNGQRPGVPEAAAQLRPFLRQYCEIVLDDLEQKEDLSQLTADITLVLGGDGAILRAARQMGYHQIPVLGVNLGRLGFLADLSAEEMCCCFPQVVAGNYRVTEHLMFECLVEGPDGPWTFLGLNEIAVQTGPPFHMIDLELIVDGEVVSYYTGDGLIVSTPIGSTAHNLSAGGPILGQELPAFALTPICPHALTSRPVVDSADKVYTIAVRRSAESSVLVVDGQMHLPLTEQHRITIRKAPVRFQLVKVPGRSYYRTLRDKLHWGLLPGYRNEQPADGERKASNDLPAEDSRPT